MYIGSSLRHYYLCLSGKKKKKKIRFKFQLRECYLRLLRKGNRWRFSRNQAWMKHYRVYTYISRKMAVVPFLCQSLNSRGFDIRLRVCVCVLQIVMRRRRRVCETHENTFARNDMDDARKLSVMMKMTGEVERRASVSWKSWRLPERSKRKLFGDERISDISGEKERRDFSKTNGTRGASFYF